MSLAGIPARTLLALVRHPSLWWTALVTAVRLVPDGWWRRRPFLPVPDRGYVRFRMVTAYGGDGTAPPEPEDLLTYLRWCRAWPRVVPAEQPRSRRRLR